MKQTETVHDYFKRKMAERAERLKNMAGMTVENARSAFRILKFIFSDKMRSEDRKYRR